jgi:hypothetical protein
MRVFGQIAEHMENWSPTLFPQIDDPEGEFCGEWKVTHQMRCDTCAFYINESCHNTGKEGESKPLPEEFWCEKWCLNPCMHSG